MDMYQTSMVGLNKYQRRDAIRRNRQIQDTTGFYGMNNTQFFFKGRCLPFYALIQKLDQNTWSTMTDANLDLGGVQIKSINQLSMCFTFMCGLILIFPLFFMCMNCWKKYTNAAYDISVGIYQSLDKIFSAPNLTSVTLTVQDNMFSAEKAGILYRHLSTHSKVTSFTFVNRSGQYDYEGTGYSDFVRNMGQIKSLGQIATNLSWGTEIVQ